MSNPKYRIKRAYNRTWGIEYIVEVRFLRIFWRTLFKTEYGFPTIFKTFTQAEFALQEEIDLRDKHGTYHVYNARGEKCQSIE